MPMPTSPVLRGVLTFALVLIASVAAGFAVGLALSEANGSDAGAPLAPVEAEGKPAATVPPEERAATGPTGEAEDSGSSPAGIEVVSSTFTPATTDSGRQRRRARVTVVLKTSKGTEQPTPAKARLVTGEEVITADPKADVANELRFNSSGAVTDRLAEERRATLLIGDRSFPLRLDTP